jgi:hypothetical protein
VERASLARPWETWSVPRLRGRGEQGEIVRQTHLVPALYSWAATLVMGRPSQVNSATYAFTHNRAQINSRTDAAAILAHHGLASEAALHEAALHEAAFHGARFTILDARNLDAVRIRLQ